MSIVEFLSLLDGFISLLRKNDDSFVSNMGFEGNKTFCEWFLCWLAWNEIYYRGECDDYYLDENFNPNWVEKNE